MRPLKFRAWDTVNRGFHEWGFDVGSAKFQGPPHDYTGRFVHEQFTGLKDKNGREIYEGDIIPRRSTCEHESCPGHQPIMGEVIFQDGSFSLEYEGDDHHRCLVYLSSWPARGEIVGNIHENPELLKVGREGNDA